MAAVLECNTEEQRSVMRFFGGGGANGLNKARDANK
jgi:hypothetical protein